MDMFEHAPCIFFVANDEGTLIELNERCCSELQYDLSELHGEKVDKIFTVASRIFYQTHFFPLLKLQNQANEIYVTLLRKDGEHLPILLNAERKLIDGSALNFFIGITVYNRKKFEDELIASKKAAEKSAFENKELLLAKKELQAHAEELDIQINLVKKQNEELKQFNKVVTHDMQEPLRKISFYSSTLVQMHEHHDKQKYINKIFQASGQMREILSGLQQYVWIDQAAIDIDKIDINSIVQSAKQKLMADFPGVELDVMVESFTDVYANSEQFYLMIYHLLSNAIRFRKEEGAAFVQIEVIRLQKNLFKTIDGKYKYVDFSRLRITDQGIGFEQEWAFQVFDLFRVLHPNSGRGVGLSICKKIVENHRGMISIESSLDSGTVVIIDLPIISLVENLSI